VQNLAFAVGEGRVSGRVDIAMSNPELCSTFALDFSDPLAAIPRDLLNDVGAATGNLRGKLRFTRAAARRPEVHMPDASGSLSLRRRRWNADSADSGSRPRS